MKSNELLKKKVWGIIQSIDKMTSKQKLTLPTSALGEDYNKLLKMVLEGNPEFEGLMPPHAETGYIRSTLENRNPKTKQSFGEIHIYCSQIYELLSDSSQK